MYNAILDAIIGLIKEDEKAPDLDRVFDFETLGATGLSKWAAVWFRDESEYQWHTNRSVRSDLFVVVRLGAQNVNEPGKATRMLGDLLDDGEDAGIKVVFRQRENLKLGGGKNVFDVRAGATTFGQGVVEDPARWYVAFADTALRCKLNTTIP